MASNIISTTKYETSANNLTGGVYTVGDSMYIDRAKLVAGNKSTICFTNSDFGSNGIIGTLEEAPDLTVTNSRMVIRLSATTDQKVGLKLMLKATEL